MGYWDNKLEQAKSKFEFAQHYIKMQITAVGPRGFELYILAQRRHLNALSDIKDYTFYLILSQIFISFDYHTQRLILVVKGNVDIFSYQHVFGKCLWSWIALNTLLSVDVDIHKSFLTYFS